MDGICQIFRNQCEYSRVCSYLFDIFLGPSYNQLPPSVKYMTVRSFPLNIFLKLTWLQTNGGKFRFNPNLYAVST